jgi:hypothetical protein
MFLSAPHHISHRRTRVGWRQWIDAFRSSAWVCGPAGGNDVCPFRDPRLVTLDIDARRIGELRRGHDRAGEVEPAALELPGLHFTDKAGDRRAADFHIVTVPTPINTSKTPDVERLRRASNTIGLALKKGDIVVSNQQMCRSISPFRRPPRNRDSAPGISASPASASNESSTTPGRIFSGATLS